MPCVPLSELLLRRKPVLLGLLGCIILWFIWRSHPNTPIIDPSYGLLDDVSESSRFAIATFLSENPLADPSDPEGTDYYYAATRVLTYQLLHADATRIRNASIDFLVLATSDLSQSKVDQLTQDGATVIRAADVPLSWWISTGVRRWKDQFTKLRLLQMTQYARILFLDADTLLTAYLDPIFHEACSRHPAQTDLALTREIKADEAPVPAHYVFCARSDNDLAGRRDHAFPPAARTASFSAGFWLAAPSEQLFALLMSATRHYRRFDPHTMEQGLLNYIFRSSGAMPWRELHYRWSATWPSERDLDGGVVSLHEKLGMEGPPERLRAIWFGLLQEMRGFYAERGAGR
ncbi:Glycosyl transferase family 8 [Macrophomina phaseolina MS6]|uniref:Glycosyl transferase family 8 n=1 Tax=Macrophomina phaseolina (strain MS6) TaxID=1126212 RepID=K2QVK0_MACPH|nr:Glycosyl transferase family 8 [Macrophomina phaseolina MS6]